MLQRTSSLIRFAGLGPGCQSRLGGIERAAEKLGGLRERLKGRKAPRALPYGSDLFDQVPSATACSSSCVPDSTIHPPAMTMIRSTWPSRVSTVRSHHAPAPDSQWNGAIACSYFPTAVLVFGIGILKSAQATLGTSVSISSVTILPLSSARRVASSYSSKEGNCFWAFLA